MADLSDVIKRLEENNKQLARLIAEKEKEDTLPDILKHAAPGVLAEKVYADKQIDKTKEHWKGEKKRDDELEKQNNEARAAAAKQHNDERKEDTARLDAMFKMDEEDGPDDIIINSAEASTEAAEKLNEASTQLAVIGDASMKEDATADSKKKEDENERNNLLNKIAAGITNVGNYFKNQGKKIAQFAKKGLGAILKGTLLAGVYLALLAFVNSKYWPKFIDILANAAEYITEKLIPYIQYIRNNIKKMGEAFSAIADFLGLTNTELALYGLGGMFAFKIISIVLRIGRTLLKVGKFITSGIITPLVDVTKLALLKSWKAIKGIGTVFKSVRLFMMTNIINPMKIALKNAATNIWDKIKTLPATLVKMRMFMVTNILNPMKIALKNAYMKGWNIIKTLPSTLRLMRIFMMTNILNPLIASATAAKAKLWTFMSKILPALIALKTFFLATLLPTLAAFAAPIGLIVLAVAAVALVLYGLYEAFQDFRDTLDRTGSIGEAIKVAIGKFVGVLLGAIPALFLKLVAFVADLFGFKEFAKKIGDIDPIQWIADTAVNFMNKIGKFFGSLFDIDFKGLLDEIVPDFVKNSWLGRQLGYAGSDTVTAEQAKQARIEAMEKKRELAAAEDPKTLAGQRRIKRKIADLDKQIAEERATGEADVQKAIERGAQGDIAQVEDLSEAEKKAFKAQQTEKTKKQTDHEGKMKNIVKNTAQQVAAASTITDLAAGFGPTSFVATPKSPVALKNQEKASTMQKQAAETAARMGISSPYTNVTAFNPTNISADKTTNHYSFDNKKFHPDSVPTMLTNAL
tara:strand:+ start:40 stop:2451 length:2412 start_codon:yes stop_codon:yes gene_type:complete